MKLSLEISAEVATSPDTSTREPFPNTMPFGLTSATCPLAVRLPRICEGF